ncbi:pleckstrin homology domain-containing family A member 6 isoform X6 [Salarias fasciatus]|uniref:pleckstrin homology domain-containing family A member 6 isoform X6 n=1 Tax=Salarias fasciatus TaxID=181472 RepID=UPI001176701D|nr:pleckstrin homology domain-containing family A member 6 isoform X6 [Salarias fasciatus]
MLKFRVDRRVSQHEAGGPAGAALSSVQLEEPAPAQPSIQRCHIDMNGKVKTADEKSLNSKRTTMVSDLSPAAQSFSRTSRTPRKAATFGKRSNSMRRNPKAEVVKQGWLHKQASSGVKQWNRRWFVLADRCLFYYKDEKEDTVLGSLPLLSFRIGGVQAADNITRKFAFKAWLEEEEEEEEDDEDLKAPVVFCMQAEHAGTRTYYFSADSHEEQGEWIRAMNGAAEVHGDRLIQRNNQDHLNPAMVTKEPDPPTHQSVSTQSESDGVPPPHPDTRSLGTPPASSPCSDPPGTQSDGRRGRQPKAAEVQDEGGRPGPDTHQHPNGWSGYDPPDSNGKAPPPRGHGHHPSADKQSQTHDGKDPQEHVVLRRGFVPRTAPERVAQRKSSMAQLQQWVNQRRGVNFQDDLSSPTHYFPVNRMLSSDYYSYAGGSQYLDEYPLYPVGVRPDSICSVSAVGGYDRHWTVKEKRRSLRDGGHLYGPPTPRDSWGPQYYGGMETSMRRLSIQPRSRSVPRSPSSSSGGHYSPVPPNFASPARSTSTRFDRFPGRMRDDLIYADPSVYSLRRSLSSPKYDFPGDRRSLNQGLFQHSYPVSPSIHSKMVPPFHDVYSRELHPTLKLNEIETSKLLGRLCEQNRILRDHETVVHRLRMDKDSLEEALVATHQEMEFYQNQPLILEKLQLKKEAHQNQLINIRGELSQASSALTTTRMEFEALEDEANAIHGDLWEQLNAGGQNELVRRHIQKEFWRVQDVLEGLHKNNSSRGTDTAKHRVTSGASGSFSTNSSASPLSSVSLTSPLSPYSSMLGCQASPTKQFGPEERPKSAVFPAEVKSKMSIEEQNERIRRHQSSSMRDKRRSLNLSSGQSPANYRVVRRRLTAHEIDIKDLEVAVRGQGHESPGEEIARLRRLHVEPEASDMKAELADHEGFVIPERYLDVEDDAPMSPEEQKEKQKKLERIKTLIAKSNLQNMVPLLDGPADGAAPPSSQQQLQEQEKRIEISCALAAEASRRSRLLSAQCTSSPTTPPSTLGPPPSSADFPSSAAAHTMKV